MRECICSSCQNLKAVINDEDTTTEFECAHGFPADTCKDCENGECELMCSNYICDNENALPVIIKCKTCGKELQQYCNDAEAGEVQCIDCFLKGAN